MFRHFDSEPLYLSPAFPHDIFPETVDQYGEYADDHVRTSRLARIPVATHLQSGKNVKKALLSISESFKNMSSTFLSDYLTEDDVNNIYNDLQQLADNND